ncbi:MAG: GNAT family N-acetyltransferase, partial [Bdellovibrionales bacterium]|nr:GNAT family N-acetyltransferase [Bdellovibrionales bacterium]
REFLPWLDDNTRLEHTEGYIRSTIEIRKSNGAPMFAIICKGSIVGLVGFHQLNNDHQMGSIGYWLSQDHMGYGIMTEAVRSVVDLGFKDLGLNRIEIRCASENTASQGVPHRLGFEYEGTLKQAENLYGRYVDHMLFAKLKQDWA